MSSLSVKWICFNKKKIDFWSNAKFSFFIIQMNGSSVS
jgi:hypothetical protein